VRVPPEGIEGGAVSPPAAALDVIRERALRRREDAGRRWTRAAAGRAGPVDAWAERFARAGRVTVNLHPDRVTGSGSTVAAGLLAHGRYLSQWVTGISSGSRSAFPGGDRHRFERALFAGAYDGADPTDVDFPVYGAFDLLRDPHGGSPRFGSSYVVLEPHVLVRTTMCVGDSHVGPADVGTADAPWSLLAGLAGQAAAGALLDRPLGADDLLDVLDGTTGPRPPSRCLDGYVEAQIHGGIDLTRDVRAVVLDPSFAGTDVERDLQAAAGRHGFELRWHRGSELAVGDVPVDFRGPTMPDVARRVARADGVVDARAIGTAARRIRAGRPLPGGDPPGSELQQLKYLWHTLLARGRDAVRA
jgi:hypothetical protein